MTKAFASFIAPLALAAAVGLSASACVQQPRAAVSLRVVRRAKTPRDASVTIDEQYVGPLGWVAARGVRLPLGEHRITVERDGYFAYDATVVATGSAPIRLDVELVPVPD
jgi:hypothetical protein